MQPYVFWSAGERERLQGAIKAGITEHSTEPCRAAWAQGWPHFTFLSEINKPLSCLGRGNHGAARREKPVLGILLDLGLLSFIPNFSVASAVPVWGVPGSASTQWLINTHINTLINTDIWFCSLPQVANCQRRGWISKINTIESALCNLQLQREKWTLQQQLRLFNQLPWMLQLTHSSTELWAIT